MAAFEVCWAAAAEAAPAPDELVSGAALSLFSSPETEFKLQLYVSFIETKYFIHSDSKSSDIFGGTHKNTM
jgi:hypothetical protein